MPTQNPVQVSRAHRWAYTCGISIKRGYRKVKAFEFSVAEHAVSAGMPAGKLLVRGSFLIAKLALLGVFLFVSFLLFVLMWEYQIFCVRAGWGLPSGRPLLYQLGLVNRSP